jgi:hypothetical protein
MGLLDSQIDKRIAELLASGELQQIKNINERRPTKVDVIQQIVISQLLQTRKDMKDYVNAVNIAKSPYNPSRAELMDIYRDISMDGHLSGIVGTIQDKIKSKPFQIVDEKDEPDEEKNKLFQVRWFFEFLDYCVDSLFYGYSLIQIGDIKNDTFSKIELIPREYVVPEKELVKKNLYAGTLNDCIYYNKPPYNRWTIFIGSTDLGLFHKVTPHCIAKKNLLISAWDNAELFGMPIRTIQTDINDELRRKNAEIMLKNMGKMSWGVFDDQDKLELVESTKSDAFNVFIQPYKISNEEISKAIIRQTGTTDEKSFVGSAEVHERTMDDCISTIAKNIGFIINDLLLPKMVLHRIPVDGFKFKWQTIEKISTAQKVTFIKDLSPFVKWEPGFIEEYTGLKGEQKESTPNPFDQPIPDKQNKSIMKDVLDYYEHKHIE